MSKRKNIKEEMHLSNFEVFLGWVGVVLIVAGIITAVVGFFTGNDLVLYGGLLLSGYGLMHGLFLTGNGGASDGL